MNFDRNHHHLGVLSEFVCLSPSCLLAQLWAGRSMPESSRGSRKDVDFDIRQVLDYGVAFTSLIFWCFLCDINNDVFENSKLTELTNGVNLTLQCRKYISKFLPNERNYNLAHIPIRNLLFSQRRSKFLPGTDQQNVEAYTKEIKTKNKVIWLCYNRKKPRYYQLQSRRISQYLVEPIGGRKISISIKGYKFFDAD